jgi:hypothetical protein
MPMRVPEGVNLRPDGPTHRLTDMMPLLAGFALAAMLSADGAQQAEPAVTTSTADLARIRAQLARNAPQIQTTIPEPTFRVEVSEEPLTWTNTIDLNDYHALAPPGGLYMFEMLRQMGNPWTGQPLIKVNVLPLAARVSRALSRAQNARAQRAVQDDVARALAARSQYEGP